MTNQGRITPTRTVVEKADFGRNDQENLPIRRPNSSRRLRPGIAPGNTEPVPTQSDAIAYPERKTAPTRRPCSGSKIRKEPS